MRRLLVLLCALTLAGCGPVRAVHPPTAPRAEPIVQTSGHAAATPAVADFELADQDGRYVRLSELHGKVVLLTFLYTQCREECPLIASTIGAVLRKVPAARRSGVEALAVTVDPEHDTRSAVRGFVARHHLPQEFRYLTGTRDALAPIWQSYNLSLDVKSVEQIEHSAYVLLIDRSGSARRYYDPHVGARELARDVARFLD